MEVKFNFAHVTWRDVAILLFVLGSVTAVTLGTVGFHWWLLPLLATLTSLWLYVGDIVSLKGE